MVSPQVHGLVFAPWVGRDAQDHSRAHFRADAVEPAQSGKSVQAA